MKQFLVLFLSFLSCMPLFSVPLESGSDTDKIIVGFTIGELPADKDYTDIDTFMGVRYYTDGKGNIFSQGSNSNKKHISKKYAKNIALITNNFDINVSRELLSNSINRTRFIENLLFSLKFDKYDGVNIDFEGIGIAEKYLFSEFIKEVYTALHPLGYEVSVDVAAKTSTNSRGWGEPYDYEEIGKNCDYIIIMAYDEHYAQGDPGPVASYNWVRNVVSYAVTVVPPEKIVLGLPSYGYDWSILPTKALSLSRVNDLINSTAGAVTYFDSTYQVPYLKYNDSSNITHTVWYEDEQSISLKVSLVNEFLLKGAAIWRLGLESEKYLSAISDTIKTGTSWEYLVKNLPTKADKKKYYKSIAKFLPVSDTPPYLYGMENKPLSINSFVYNSIHVLSERDDPFNREQMLYSSLSIPDSSALITKTASLTVNPAEYLYSKLERNNKKHETATYFSRVNNKIYKN